jgi:hypothetical protein
MYSHHLENGEAAWTYRFAAALARADGVIE